MALRRSADVAPDNDVLLDAPGPSLAHAIDAGDQDLRRVVEQAWAAVVRRRPGKPPLRRSALPPLALVRDMLAHSRAPLPRLARTVRAPIFTPDGRIQLAPGYDADSHTYYAPAPGFTLRAVPRDVAALDLAYARDLLLDDLLGDFPFVVAAERAHRLHSCCCRSCGR